MIEIIPAILTNSQDGLEKAVHLIGPYTTRAHLDIADGIFVPNETISGYSELRLISTGLKFDIHLMVQNPVEQISHWREIEKADRFIVHIESTDATTAVKEFRDLGKGIGLALNPDTPITDIEPFVGLVDFIQFMTVHPGFQGGDFLDYVVEKIESFHNKYPEAVIAVDGSINSVTAKSVIDAGASMIISGSFIITSGDVGKVIEELRKIGENKT